MSYSIEQRDEQLVGTKASIRYTLSFPNCEQHLVDVTMEVDTESEMLVLALPNWVPGSYKVRDFISHQGDVEVRNVSGELLPFKWIAKNRFRVWPGKSRNVRISYRCYSTERSVRLTHVNRFHAFINPGTCLLYVEGRTEEPHHVAIEHPWREVTTALSPVRANVWGALNYDILVDSPIEIGDHFVARFERHGSRHEVAITGTGDFDPKWITEQIKIVVDRAVELWGKLPYDRYIFINQLLPGQYGGLEHARCSVNMFDSESFTDKEKTVKFLTLLCHEYFHVWNVKRIRPVELGPFDYESENYTRMLWLAEGATSYYDDLMAYRCGFHSRDGYLKTLSKEHLARLLDVPGRLAMSIKDSSFLSWVKLYIPTPDSLNRFPSYYLKGGVIFLLLDMTIIAQTNGEKSLDDAMRALMERYYANPATGITEEEFLDIVESATGGAIREKFLHWIDTASELPIVETVTELGLEWQKKAVEEKSTFGADLEFQDPDPVVWTGLQVEEIKTGLKVARVWRDSPAESAGLGAEDELIAIDGVRVTSSKQWEAQLRGALRNGPVTLTAASEGRLYEAVLEPEARDSYELVEVAEPTDDQRKRREKWLFR